MPSVMETRFQGECTCCLLFTSAESCVVCGVLVSAWALANRCSNT